MKKTITSLVLVGLGIMLFESFGAILLGLGAARLLFQAMEWALNGGEVN
jgi:hypothetical protein